MEPWAIYLISIIGHISILVKIMFSANLILYIGAIFYGLGALQDKESEHYRASRRVAHIALASLIVLSILLILLPNAADTKEIIMEILHPNGITIRR